MLSCEFCKTFKNTYFEDPLQTSTSINYEKKCPTDNSLLHFLSSDSYHTQYTLHNDQAPNQIIAILHQKSEAGLGLLQHLR